MHESSAGCLCRLAFHGHICRLIDPSDPAQLRQLRVCKSKSRQGSVERVEADGCTAVCRGMFKKDTDMALFTGEYSDGVSDRSRAAYVYVRSEAPGDSGWTPGKEMQTQMVVQARAGSLACRDARDG